MTRRYKADPRTMNIEAVSEENLIFHLVSSRFQSSLVLTNRALAHYNLNLFAESLADANAALELDRAWVKGYFHKIRSLLALDRPQEAQVAYSIGMEMGGDASLGFRDLEEVVTKSYISVHYDQLTADMPVRVGWIDKDKGKGLFAKQRLRMFQPIFSEAPLLSHQKMPSANVEPCCSHCLRSFLSLKQIEETKFAKKASLVYPETPHFVWCERCEKRSSEMDEMDPEKISDPFLRGNPFFLARYCSETCREAAEESYHLVLCGADFISSDARVHPLHHLYNLCTELQSSVPFFVARIFAVICQRIVGLQMSPEEAMQDFRNFVSSEDAQPGDEMALFLIKNLFVRFPFMNDIVSLSSYQRFTSAIRRNAQTVSPVSDLHSWFENELKKSTEADSLMKSLGFTADSLKDYMATDVMTLLSKNHGAALLPIGNCTNHSCDPNVIASSSHNNHTITFVAINQIDEGDELLISYVDDNLDWKERHALLNEFYRFECTCIRCHVQKENVKLIE